MRCRYCGQRIPEGELYCRHCGKEVRIVPDYNPLDDMLTAQIKGAIDSDGYEDEMYYSRPSRNRDAAGRSTTGSRRGNERRSTGVARNNTRSRQMNEDERRRRNRERARQKALRKKKEKACTASRIVPVTYHRNCWNICLYDIIYRCGQQGK